MEHGHMRSMPGLVLGRAIALDADVRFGATCPQSRQGCLGIGALSGGRWRRGKEIGSYHCSSASPSCSVFYPAEVYDEPCAVWCSRKFGLDLCGLQSTHVHVANLPKICGQGEASTAIATRSVKPMQFITTYQCSSP